MTRFVYFSLLACLYLGNLECMSMSAEQKKKQEAVVQIPEDIARELEFKFRGKNDYKKVIDWAKTDPRNLNAVAPDNRPLLFLFFKGGLIDQEEGRAAMIKLIELGADVNKLYDDGSLLFKASSYGLLDVMKALLSHGAQVNQEVSNGYTALNIIFDSQSIEDHLETVIPRFC